MFRLLVEKGYSIKDINVVSKDNTSEFKEYEEIRQEKMGVEFDWKDDYLSTVSLMVKVMGPDLENFNEDLKEEFKDCLEDWHIE